VPRHAHLHPPLRKGRLASIQTDYLVSTREFIRDHEKKVREYEEQPEELVSNT
jgi:hypothetical protein